MKRLLLTLPLVLLLAAMCQAAGPAATITGPTEGQAGDMAVFRVESAWQSCKWFIVPKSDHFLPILLPDGSQAAIFASRVTGNYTVGFVAATEGEVVVALHAFANKAAPGPEPNPNPQPDPQPGPRRLGVVIIEESSERSPAQARLYASPRLRSYLDSQRHLWFLADRDIVNPEGRAHPAYAPYVKLCTGKSLPQVFLYDQATSITLFQGNVPETEDELLAILKRYGG